MPTCDQCNQPAVYHDVRIVDGVHNTTHLCIEHAYEAGVDLGPVDISSVLQSAAPSESIKSCSDCGMTIPQYKTNSLLGCPACYETFRQELTPVIAKVQNTHTQHVGRSPNQTTVDMDRQLQIRRLLQQLDSAVHLEQYEDAAHLRDKLRELDQSGGQSEN
ncbi:MAG: protein arginine kinase activator [Phycisphaerales bacterium]|jgi:protein arginine kinase activator